jgi:hypothetical protein
LIEETHVVVVFVGKGPCPVLPFCVRLLCFEEFFSFTGEGGVGGEDLVWGGGEEDVDVEFVERFAECAGFFGEGLAGL